MKKVVLIAVAVALTVVISNPVAAQQVRDETKLTYQVLTEEWTNLIGGALDLTDEEKAAFAHSAGAYRAVR